MRITLLFLSFSLYLSVIGQSQEIRFNEVQSSNSNFLDEDGDSPDWLELINKTSTDISLSSWSITNDIDDPKKWVFPDYTLNSGEILQLWASKKDRKSVGVARTLVDQGHEFKYLTPNGNPNSNWRKANFDDSSWNSGPSGFGYGDGDDNTPIASSTKVIYLRTTFNITDKSKIKELLFHADYDDAFVAYINENEIARANISGFNPSFFENPETDHEAQIYQGGMPDVFKVFNLEEILIDGENILSIQTHNISVNSSDLTMIPFLSAYYAENSSEGLPANPILNLQLQKFHTNFKLPIEGSSLYLFDEQQNLIDSLNIPALCPNVSYAYTPQNADWVYFNNGSPGTENGQNYHLELSAEEVQFSHPGGVVGPMSLQLSAIGNPEIRYTLDATLPTTSSQLYSSPINIGATTIVRAKSFAPNRLSCHEKSAAYLMDVVHDLPVLSLITEPDNLFSEETGIYTYGNNYEFSLPYFGANFWLDKEVPMHLSIFETNGIDFYTFNGGAKIFGGWSRANDQRSFSIFSRGEYGQNSIEYPIFKNRAYTSYQAFTIRNAGNDWLRSNLRDVTLTSLMEGSGLEIQANKSIVAYINGEYWGLYHIREKINEHYIASKTGVDVNTIDLLEIGGSVVFGDNSEYLELLDFINNNNLQSNDKYKIVEAQVDIENLIVYFLANIYFDNTDWPGNNIKFWKSPTTKWRWLMYDTDFGFGVWNSNSYSNNTINFALASNGPNWPNPPWSTLLFRKLNQNKEFKHRFINRFADELNTRFLPLAVQQHIEMVANRIASEIPDHFNRWGQSSFSWNTTINSMKTFGNLRNNQVKNHILSTYQLPAFYKLTVENDFIERGFVQLNSLSLKSSNWSGDYFKTVPIDLTAIPNDGYIFSHWEGSITSTNQKIQLDLQSAMKIKPVFKVDESPFPRVIVNEINYNSSLDHDTDDWIELYNRSENILDLSEWTIKDTNDGNVYSFPSGTKISNKSYLVIAKDLSAFKTLHPQTNNVVGNLNFGFSASEDEVRIFNSQGQLMDSVAYKDSSPWPAQADGEGFTLELLHPDFDRQEPSNWAPVHPFGSPGKSNLENTMTIESEHIQEFLVFPNPSQDQINIKLSLSKSLPITIQLIDINGQIVKSIFEGDLAPGTHQITKDIFELSSGSYFLELKHNQQRLNSIIFTKI